MQEKFHQLLKSRTLLFGIILFLVGASFVGMSYRAGFKSIASHIINADAVWLLLIIASQSVAYWAYVLPYKHVFKISYKRAANYSFSGFHPFLAGGGTRFDVATHISLGSKARVYYLGLWEYAALAPAVMVASIYGYIHGGIPSNLILPWIIGVPTGTVLFTLAIIFRKNISKFPYAHKLVNFMLDMLKQQSAKELTILMAGMLLYWTGELFALWGALQLFDIKLGWFALLVAYATGYVISRRSLPLGGAGLILVTLALSLHWVGATLSVALLAALTYQVSNLLMPVIYRKATQAQSS